MTQTYVSYARPEGREQGARLPISVCLYESTSSSKVEYYLSSSDLSLLGRGPLRQEAR